MDIFGRPAIFSGKDTYTKPKSGYFKSPVFDWFNLIRNHQFDRLSAEDAFPIVFAIIQKHLTEFGIIIRS